MQDHFQTTKMADLLHQVIVHAEVQDDERAFIESRDNCSRYAHKYQRISASRYVPRPDCGAPFAEWKRIDLVQEALPPRDAGKTAQAGGTITVPRVAFVAALL